MSEVRKLISRIIALPFFMGMALIASLGTWLLWSFNFLKYGGEAVAYTEKSRPKSILDVYHKLKEIQDNE